jgi:quercetin dioxygenase-like cupin family protein
MSPGALTRIELTTPDATLRFDRQADRYSHCLLVHPKDQLQVVLQGFLADPNAPWPSDPPLQQLVLEPIGDREFPDVALGVGMSGHGHWSLAAQWLRTPRLANSGPANSGLGSVALEFDFACKLRPPVGFLGSTYRVVPQRYLPSGSSGLEWMRVDFGKQHWTGWFKESTSPSSIPSHKLSIAVLAGELQWDADSQEITVRPIGSLEKPATLRWCYRVAWIACDE